MVALRARCGGSSSRRTGCCGGSAEGLDPKPMRLFHGSITYLTLLFLAVAAIPFTRF